MAKEACTLFMLPSLPINENYDYTTPRLLKPACESKSQGTAGRGSGDKSGATSVPASPDLWRKWLHRSRFLTFDRSCCSVYCACRESLEVMLHKGKGLSLFPRSLRKDYEPLVILCVPWILVLARYPFFRGPAVTLCNSGPPLGYDCVD
jgi:hypothetical protein